MQAPTVTEAKAAEAKTPEPQYESFVITQHQAAATGEPHQQPGMMQGARAATLPCRPTGTRG